jgi:hypothetical protein
VTWSTTGDWVGDAAEGAVAAAAATKAHDSSGVSMPLRGG